MQTTPVQDWHTVILEMLLQAKQPISPQNQPNIKLERVKELEAMDCVEQVKSGGNGFAYKITDLGRKYLMSLKNGSILEPAAWEEDAELPILYLAHGDVREAIPHIIDGFNKGQWDEQRYSIVLALKATDNGYAHMVADIWLTPHASLGWVEPETPLVKHRDVKDAEIVTINFQLSPLAEEAFKVVSSYMKRKGLRTHRQSGVASKGLAGEYALIMAASIIQGSTEKVSVP